MRCTHVGLPQVPALPVFVEHEVGRIVVVLVQVVVDAALFGARDIYQFQQLGLDQVDHVRVGLDVGDDSEMGHV